MKKLIALLVFILMLLPTIAFATTPTTLDDNTEIVLTKKQRDILQALGVAESEIDNLSGAEIGELISEGNIVDYSYLEPYLPSMAEIEEDRKRAEMELDQLAKKMGNVTAAELSEYFAKTKESPIYISSLNPKELKEFSDDFSNFQFRRSLDTMRIPQNLSNYTKFPNASQYGYAYPSCYIHRNALNTAYSKEATSAHYNELKTKIASCKAIGNYIFQKNLSSSSNYAYNLWGDYYEEASTTHQGIDFTLKKGQPVYNIYKGKVVNRFEQLGGITMVIYDDVLKLNFIYMHIQNPKYVVGDTIPTLAVIGEQGEYKYLETTNTHTHLEVVPKDRMTPYPSNKEIVYSKNPYTAALYYIP